MNGGVERQSLEAFVGLLGEDPFDTAIILGSGLGGLADLVEQARVIPYGDIPGFPAAAVSGHCGRLVLGTLSQKRVAVFQGRFHLYEGYSAREATVNVRLAHALGCRRILLSCAAGGIRPDFRPGDFMIVNDHINLMGDNPLRGQESDPFLDLSELYNDSFWEPLKHFAAKARVRLHSGVLAALTGPSYETPAEIRMIERLGGDAVSMSTVPEAIMARYLGLNVSAMAFVSNMAAGRAGEVLDHKDVLARGRQGSSSFCALTCRLIELWGDGEKTGQGFRTSPG